MKRYSNLKSRKREPKDRLNDIDIAVGIAYGDQIGVPEVSAIGQRKMAKQIRKIASRYGIPVLKDKKLAENLNRVDSEEDIPTQFYGDIARLFRKAEGE